MSYTYQHLAPSLKKNMRQFYVFVSPIILKTIVLTIFNFLPKSNIKVEERKIYSAIKYIIIDKKTLYCGDN